MWYLILFTISNQGVASTAIPVNSYESCARQGERVKREQEASHFYALNNGVSYSCVKANW